MASTDNINYIPSPPEPELNGGRWAVTYEQTEWSKPYELEPVELDADGFSRIGDCDDIAEWLEGILPGVYHFTNGDDYFVITVPGAPIE